MLTMEQKTKFMKDVRKNSRSINMSTISDLSEIWDYESEYAACEKELKEKAQTEGFEIGHAEGLAEGHAEGLAEGFAEGIEETHASIIETMLKLNYPMEEISKITGKSISEIEEISKK